MTIKIIDITKNPLQRIGEVASTCWNSNAPTSEHKKQIAIDCIDSGHHRVLEYVDMIISIEGYSARMARELYTAMVGVSKLQESTRYVDCSNFNYYIPESIKNNEDALVEYNRIMQHIKWGYNSLQKLDIPKQDIANILPLGMMTKVILKINLRALLHMAELRMCNRALKEYRDFMQELKNILIEIDDEWKVITYHYMHPKCEILGYCTEKNSCKMMPKKEDVII
jgi:thymidylate synthase (FAD)